MTPQHNTPHALPPCAPDAAQVSPETHAAPEPHMHVSFTHCSPAAQHAVPHSGPLVHVPDGPQVAAASPRAASIVHPLPVHDPPELESHAVRLTTNARTIHLMQPRYHVVSAR